MDRIPAIRRVILAQTPAWCGAAWAAAAVAAPTAAGMALDLRQLGTPFILFFPSILLAALLLGRRWGVAVLIGCSVAADWAFLGQDLGLTFERIDLQRLAIFALTGSALIWVGAMARRLVQELEQAKARESLLNAELMHRVKNMLATVNAMAVLTARHAEPKEFAKVFTGRMRALDKATELLGAGSDVHCEIHTLVESAIAPFRTDGNFAVEGGRYELPRNSCVPLALALHELCTNAAKHGSLSAPEGRVLLGWTCDAAGLLTIDWREEGGPPVTAPARTGMGTQLLRRQNGLKDVELMFRPEGVTCRIWVEGATPGAGVERAA